MASRLCFRAKAIPSFSFSSSSTIRRRLPLVGAFCVLSFGLPSLFSAACRTTSCAPHSLPFALLLRELWVFRSNFGSQAKAMEGPQGSSSTTVPSIVVYVTVPNKEVGIQSVYQWEGEVQTDSEELLIIKTRQSLFEALTEHVKSNHPYDVPEVIALPINAGSLNYLEWIKNSTRD
ncbi:hypothetical protein ACLB2K_046040 [Fragaria x ananassa]